MRRVYRGCDVEIACDDERDDERDERDDERDERDDERDERDDERDETEPAKPTRVARKLSGYVLAVDTRERKIVPYLANHTHTGITHHVDQLKVGDYVFCRGSRVLFVVERKTWVDLASSMRDKRKYNINKLFKLRDECACAIVYLIEGTPLPAPDSWFSNISYKSLRAHLDHIMFRDNVHVTHTRDYADTARRLHELCVNYTTWHVKTDHKHSGNARENHGDEYDENGSGIEDGGGDGDGGGDRRARDGSGERAAIDAGVLARLKQPPEPRSVRNTHTLMLQRLQGIGTIMGPLLIDAGITLELIVNRDAQAFKRLCELKNNNRAFGEKKARRVFACVFDAQRFPRVLTCVKGVGEKTAKMMMRACDVGELMRASPQQIAQMKRNANSRVGEKLAQSLYDCLHYRA